MKKNLINWLPLFFYCAIIFTASSRPAVQVSHDKLVHLIIYTLLGFLMVRALVQTWPHRQSLFLIVAPLLTTLYGASDEAHQYFIPGRSCSGWDLLADASGALLGVLIYVLFPQLQRCLPSSRA